MKNHCKILVYLGTGKSLIFSKIMEIQQLKRQYDLKIQQSLAVEGGTIMDKNINYRHAILNEVKYTIRFVLRIKMFVLFYIY